MWRNVTWHPLSRRDDRDGSNEEQFLRGANAAVIREVGPPNGDRAALKTRRVSDVIPNPRDGDIAARQLGERHNPVFGGGSSIYWTGVRNEDHLHDRYPVNGPIPSFSHDIEIG